MKGFAAFVTALLFGVTVTEEDYYFRRYPKPCRSEAEADYREAHEKTKEEDDEQD